MTIHAKIIYCKFNWSSTILLMQIEMHRKKYIIQTEVIQSLLIFTRFHKTMANTFQKFENQHNRLRAARTWPPRPISAQKWPVLPVHFTPTATDPQSFNRLFRWRYSPSRDTIDSAYTLSQSYKLSISSLHNAILAIPRHYWTLIHLHNEWSTQNDIN